MCIGIAIVGIVPVDGGPIQFYGENGNSSHDKLLSENVPVELHNRSVKIEYIFPNTVRLDAPDSACQEQAVAFGVADMEFGTAVLRSAVTNQVWRWLSENPLKHDNTTLREANLWGADLREADLRGADLREADLRGADLWGANLQGANLRGANLLGANLRGADLQGADLWGAVMPAGWTA
mgnify:CR=1 FL=1